MALSKVAGARQRADGLSAGIGEPRKRDALFGHGADADHPVLGLEEDLEPFGHVIRHQRGRPMPRLTRLPGRSSLAPRGGR